MGSRVWVGWALASALLVACGGTRSDPSSNEVPQSAAHPARKLELRLVSESSANAEQVATWSGEAPLPLEREVLLSARDVADVELVANSDGDGHFLSIELTPEAGQRFEEMTGRNVGRRLAVVVGDRVAFAPVIKAKISGGKLAITAHSDAEIHEMQRLLGG